MTHSCVSNGVGTWKQEMKATSEREMQLGFMGSRGRLQFSYPMANAQPNTPVLEACPTGFQIETPMLSDQDRYEYADYLNARCQKLNFWVEFRHETQPEMASVGKTEELVNASGVPYKVGKFPLLANSRARAIDDAEGLVKVVVEKETDRIHGVHVMDSQCR
uniref:Pyridine nucleotide-disulphide oxidoreductase dimerisation domain-containing protein n=1 Tax=Oryza brachyantha TaxID=4533 RepID=J3M465_ORYBR